MLPRLASLLSTVHPRRRVIRHALLLATGGVLTNPARAVSAPAPVTLGSWSAGMDADPAVLDALEGRIGAPVGIASIFRGMGDAWPYPNDAALGARRTLLVSWSLEDWGSYAWWAAGNGDAVIRDQAARLLAYGRPVAIRPWAEMNADWASHQVRPAGSPQAPRGGTPAEFVAAWRRVVGIMRSAGVTNVRWVLAPTTDTYAQTSDVRTYFPGADVVDVLGLDGYNWGDGSGHEWRSFEDVFWTQYARLVSLAPTLPVWLCEISCADPLSAIGPDVTAPTGTSKGDWWTDLGVALGRGYENVQAIVFFDAAKERDWRVASSVEALAGLRTALAQSTRLP